MVKVALKVSEFEFWKLTSGSNDACCFTAAFVYMIARLNGPRDLQR